MQRSLNTSTLKSAIADHARSKCEQALPDSELEDSSKALCTFFELLSQTHKKVMKDANEPDHRNSNHTN